MIVVQTEREPRPGPVHTMGWFDWFWGLLRVFGDTRKPRVIAFLGLDNAGKSTLLMRLSCDQLKTVCPTLRPRLEDVRIGDAKVRRACGDPFATPSAGAAPPKP